MRSSSFNARATELLPTRPKGTIVHDNVNLMKVKTLCLSFYEFEIKNSCREVVIVVKMNIKKKLLKGLKIRLKKKRRPPFKRQVC